MRPRWNTILVETDSDERDSDVYYYTPRGSYILILYEMDRYDHRVPIRILSSSTRYNGRVWYEPLASIRSINGTSVTEGQVEKSMLKHGDRVTLEYKNRTCQLLVDVKTEMNPAITECAIKSLELPLEAWQDNTKNTSTRTSELQPRQLETSPPKRKLQQAGTPRKRPNRLVHDTPQPLQAGTSPRKGKKNT